MCSSPFLLKFMHNSALLSPDQEADPYVPRIIGERTEILRGVLMERSFSKTTPCSEYPCNITLYSNYLSTILQNLAATYVFTRCLQKYVTEQRN
jgi:hypothetical protein